MDQLPDGTRLLHIGPQKTGSTAIQAALHRARAALREHGVVYPGPHAKPRDAAEVGLGFGRIKPRGTQEDWEQLLRQVHDPDARLVCVSLEAFGRATDEQAARVVEQLGAGRPHVLLVARRYDALLPSQWQQRVKSQLRLSYDEWLRVVLGPRPADETSPEHQHWTNLWVPHDTVALARRWASVAGEDHVTVVVRDEADRDQMHALFEQLLGVPAGLLPRDTGGGNTSLSLARTELVRRVNALFHERGWIADDVPPDYERLRMAAVRALVQAPDDPRAPRTPALPDWARARVAELGDARAEGLAQLPVRLVGDPDRLRTGAADDPRGAPPPTEVSAQDAAEAFVAMVAAATEDQPRRARRRQA